jgi:putative PIN family toxin of toxin-antitoxin system
MLRAVVDTNVWVSALLNPRGYPSRVLEALRSYLFELVLSDPMLDELFDVLTRPRLTKKYGLQLQDIAEFGVLLEQKAVKVDPPGKLRICRDPRDNMVLETAVIGRADFAVSRDDDIKRDPDLIENMTAHRVRVVSVRQFLEVLTREGDQAER